MTFQHEVDRIFVIDWSRCYFYSPYKCYITESNFKWTEYQIALNINKYIDFTPWHLCFQICSNTQLIWQSRVYVYIIANITWNKKKKIIKSKWKWKRYTRFFIRSFSFSTLNAKRSSDFWTTLFLLLCGGGETFNRRTIFCETEIAHFSVASVSYQNIPPIRFARLSILILFFCTLIFLLFPDKSLEILFFKL